MKKIFSVLVLFAFMFTNVSFAPAMAATYQTVAFRNEVVYPPTTTQTVTQTVTETTVTETTSTRVYEEPVVEEVVVTEEASTGEKIGMAVLGTLLIGGLVALAVLDDEPHHPHHHGKPHKAPGPHGGHKPPHRR